jgi:hypothetical protein
MSGLKLYRIVEDGLVHYWASAASRESAIALVRKELEAYHMLEDVETLEAAQLSEEAGKETELREDDNADNMWDAHMLSTDERLLAFAYVLLHSSSSEWGARGSRGKR